MKWLQRLFFKGSYLLLLMIVLQAAAQSGEVVHAIAQGETLSGLARQYHTTVGDIMRLNGMDSKSVLRIGQKVKIPSKSVKQNIAVQRNAPVTKRAVTTSVTPEVTVQSQEPAATESATTHIVGQRETLYGIGKKYNVSVDQIKEWNHLSGNNIHEGQRLSINGSTTTVSDVVASKPEVVETASPSVTSSPSQAATSPNSSQPVAGVNKNEGETNPSSSKVPSVAKQEDPIIDLKNTSDAGYFAYYYHQGKRELSGDAATFKTASGWVDKKYYILVNNIDAGTVVRLTANNKIIFAKVLGSLPDIKEDNGLLLRLSNSAASVLGLADSKFPVVVNY
jgi:LysM repeat protein